MAFYFLKKKLFLKYAFNERQLKAKRKKNHYFIIYKNSKAENQN